MFNLQKKYIELEEEREKELMSQDEYYTRLILLDIEVENSIETMKQDYLEKKFRK